MYAFNADLNSIYFGFQPSVFFIEQQNTLGGEESW